MSEILPQDLDFSLESSPFNPDNELAYRRWSEYKRHHYPTTVQAQKVAITRLNKLTDDQRRQLIESCRRANFALYQSDPQIPFTLDDLRALGTQLGLTHHDHHLWAPDQGISAIRKEITGRRARYIPYTDRPIKWHTDGYYSSPETAVRGLLLHCVMPAAEGGTNQLLDPEMLYIAIRDENPAFIKALMQPQAMTIPANTLEPGNHRPAICGPVFSVDPTTGSLHMRYTARTRSIHWQDDAITRDAVAFLEALLTPPVSFAFTVRMKAGEGLVCNNVLHNREAFSDDPASKQQRLLWRARYRDRIAGSSLSQGVAD